MKSKLSLRKKVIMQTIIPAVIIVNCGVSTIRGQGGMLTNIIMFLDIVFLLFMLIYTNLKDCEPTDEMTKLNQFKAAYVAYIIILATVGLVMLYALRLKTSIIISVLSLTFIFVGMVILSLVIFLFYDIRGN